MRDLAALEIDPLHPIYQKGLDTLLESLMDLRHLEGRDLCVAAMFASLLAYGQRESWQILPLIRYLVDHAQPDGGWNCGMFSHDTKKSSVHTHGLRMNEQADKANKIIPKDQKEFRVWGRIR